MDAIASIGKIMPAITGGMGLVSNIIQGNRQNSLQADAVRRARELTALVNNPALFNAKIKALQQPLSQGLVAGTGQEVQGLMAERGLGGSPQQMEEVLAQALGPQIQNEQQMAINALLSGYGVGNQTTGTAMNTITPTDTSTFWQMLQKANTPQLPGGSSSPGGLTPSGGSSSGDYGYGGTTPYLPPDTSGGSYQFPGTGDF